MNCCRESAAPWKNLSGLRTRPRTSVATATRPGTAPRASDPNRQEDRTAMSAAADPVGTGRWARTTNNELGSPPLHHGVSAPRISAFFPLQSSPASSAFPPNNNSTDHDRGKGFQTVSLAAARALSQRPRFIKLSGADRRHHPPRPGRGRPSSPQTRPHSIHREHEAGTPQEGNAFLATTAARGCRNKF